MLLLLRNNNRCICRQEEQAFFLVLVKRNQSERKSEIYFNFTFINYDAQSANFVTKNL